MRRKLTVLVCWTTYSASLTVCLAVSQPSARCGVVVRGAVLLRLRRPLPRKPRATASKKMVA